MIKENGYVELTERKTKMNELLIKLLHLFNPGKTVQVLIGTKNPQIQTKLNTKGK